MKKIPDIIKHAARDLRTHQTQAEAIVWGQLRNQKMGYKFQRQLPIYVYTENSGLDRYIIADFYCSEKKLILEIDGEIHHQKEIYDLDKYKETILIQLGYTIIRYSNQQVLENGINIGNKIKTYLDSLQPLSLEKGEDSGESSEFKTGLGKKKRFIMRNESFTCENCGKEISKHPSGSARNHCPFCLHSKHLDKIFPGDRASDCHGLMHPVGKDYHKNKGWMVVHECQKCGKKIPNKLAEDDSVDVFGRL